ncbi:PIN domain-containing protein [Saccharomonospora iraqiensis]|uniref:PIN domain-containing protein n=1 Tax=Saccharomonospora iraqiensis TaxID=52698 RepID=UPI00022E0B26|nr:PIN domain-containing protein [Saccharomonospora iraqiensis]
MRVVLDTSVVVGELTPVPGRAAISSVTIAELHFGVLMARDAQARAARLRRLSTLERLFDPLPVDDAVSVSYGELAAAVANAGRQPRARSMDLLIAATAHAHDAALHTRNAKDLKGIEHLVDITEV